MNSPSLARAHLFFVGFKGHGEDMLVSRRQLEAQQGVGRRQRGDRLPLQVQSVLESDVWFIEWGLERGGGVCLPQAALYGFIYLTTVLCFIREACGWDTRKHTRSTLD